MKINVCFDDLRDCHDGIILAKNIEDLQTLIKTREIGIQSLNYDLVTDAFGQLIPLIYVFLKGLFVEQFYLYTDNVIQKDNIQSVLKVAHKRAFMSLEIKVYL